jgi:hypothetical protein
MGLVRLVARLATRRGTLVGAVVVVAAVVLPLALRGSSRGSWTLPAPSDARQSVSALRDRSRSAAAAAVNTAGRVRSALVPAGT